VRCPFCSHTEDKVVDSRMAKEGEAIRRRRECLGCKRRFTTYERVDEVLPMIIKKDGRREPFDRAKVLAGLRKACEKRPISIATLEVIAEDRKAHSGARRDRGPVPGGRRRSHECTPSTRSSRLCSLRLRLPRIQGR